MKTNSNDNDQASSGGISRREFMIRAGATAALVAGSSAAAYKLWQPKHFVPGFGVQTGLQLPSYAVGISKVLPSLAIAHGSDHEKVVRAAIGALGGMGRFVQHGDVVVLKPNVAFDRPPALAATTHPETLAAVAKLVLEAGASSIPGH